MDNQNSNVTEADERIQEAVLSLAKRFLPTIIENLLLQGKLNEGDLSDPQKVWTIVMTNLDLIEDIRARFHIEEEFIKAAKDELLAGRKWAAIVLAATAVEQIMNIFYRSMLEQDLPHEMITDIIKSSAYAKTGWLMYLVSRCSLPDELYSRINRLINLRNGIVHYKDEPSKYMDDDISGSYNSLEQQIKNFDFDDMLRISTDLQGFLSKTIDESLPYRKLSEETAKLIISQ